MFGASTPGKVHLMSDHRVAVVIEDDEDIRGLLEVVLLQSGFEVHSTDSGVKGVELVEFHRPDLVTLDLAFRISMGSKRRAGFGLFPTPTS